VRPETHLVGSPNRPRRPRHVVGAIARGSGGDGAERLRLTSRDQRVRTSLSSSEPSMFSSGTSGPARWNAGILHRNASLASSLASSLCARRDLDRSAVTHGFGTLRLSGFAHLTGQPDEPPPLPPFALAEGIAALAGSIAVMFALYHRDVRGGRGQVIDLTIIAPILTVLGAKPTVYCQLRLVPVRTGNRTPHSRPPSLPHAVPQDTET
jgi:hypothetical protein